MYNLNLLQINQSPNINGNKSQTIVDESDLNETKILVQKATESMIDTFDKKGERFVEDWAVDELLSWTSGLRYDELQLFISWVSC